MLALLDKLKQLYQLINKIPSQVKTLIIVALIGVVCVVGIDYRAQNILQDYTEQVRLDKQQAEEYTKTITPLVNGYMESILIKDTDAKNVILLNYHNTLVSSNGLSYRYLTALVEKRRTTQVRSSIKIWKELEYINYGEEIQKVNDRTYLLIDSIHKYEVEYPNLTELLAASGATGAALYPISGVDGPLGMIIVMYDQVKIYGKHYYKETISPISQPLSSLLDYYNIKSKFESTPRQKFINEYTLR